MRGPCSTDSATVIGTHLEDVVSDGEIPPTAGPESAAGLLHEGDDESANLLIVVIVHVRHLHLELRVRRVRVCKGAHRINAS